MNTEATAQYIPTTRATSIRVDAADPEFDAVRGLKIGLRSNSRFAVHIFTTVLLGMIAIALNCAVIEWVVLIVCICMLFTAELFCGVVRRLVAGSISVEERKKINAMAAGGVLIVRLTLVIVAGLIFANRLLENLSPII